MAKATHMTAPADILKGRVEETDGRKVIDTGIGIIMEPDEDCGKTAGDFTDVRIDDCDHATWDNLYSYIKAVREACEELNRKIDKKENLKIRIKDRTIVDEYRNHGKIPGKKNIEVVAEGFPIRFEIPHENLSGEDKHAFYNGKEIEAVCNFNDFSKFNWLKRSINDAIILTPRAVEPGEKPKIDDTVQGYVINCDANLGIFVYYQGWTGLIYKKYLPGSFAEECRNGTISRTYPVGGKIEVVINNFLIKEGEERISMRLGTQTASISTLMTDKDLNFKIIRIDEKDERLFISWQDMELYVSWGADNNFFLKQRIRNKVYKVNDMVNGKVVEENGRHVFVMSGRKVRYAIKPGDILEGRLRNHSFVITDKDGNEMEFTVKTNEWLAPILAEACLSKQLTIEARCCELTELGDPLFAIRSHMRKLGENLTGKTFTAEVVDISGHFIIWKYGHLVGVAQIRNTSRAYSPGDMIDISVTMQNKVPFYQVDEKNFTWDETLDIKPGDIIQARILTSAGEGVYTIAHKDMIGTCASGKKHQHEDMTDVKVVYFNAAEKRLDCIETCGATVLPTKITGAEVHIISYIGGRHWWTRYGEDFFLMHLENDYPSYVCQFLLKNGNDVTLDITSDGDHMLNAVHAYDHSRISSLTVTTGDRTGARIEGQTCDGFILSVEDVYCIMPYELTDWNSHIYVEKDLYPVGTILMTTVKNRTASCVFLNHKDTLTDHWNPAPVHKEEEVTCRILQNLPDGSVIVKTGCLVGTIAKADLSWFSFIETDRFMPGKEIRAHVKDINPTTKTLTLRAVGTDNPWRGKFRCGERYEVTVTEVYCSSVIVRTDDGLEGSMTISDLTVLPYEDCRNLVRVGDRFNAEISGRYDNLWKITFRKADLEDTSARDSMHLGQVISGAKVIKVSCNEVYFDLGGNICGIMPNRLIGEMVEGYRTGDPLSSLFRPNQLADVKICRLVSGEKKIYVTGPKGSEFDNVPSGRRTGTIVSMEDKRMTVRFSHNDREYFASLEYNGLWSAWERFRYNTGDDISFTVTGLDKDRWIYNGNIAGIGQNPWTAGGHPETGNVLDAEVIGISSKGKAVVLAGGITWTLSGTSLLTDTPWIQCADEVHALKTGDRIKVLVSDYNAKGRNMRLIPYQEGYKDDVRTGNLTVRHVCSEGLYAECDSYGCICFVPKEELFWCPVSDAESLFDIGEGFFGERIGFDLDAGMPLMSRKRLLAHADSKTGVGDIIEGTVRKVTPDALVLLCGSFENVVGLKNLTWDPVESLDEDFIGRNFHVGDTVSAKVIARNEEDMTLSIKETIFNPWTYCSLEGSEVQTEILKVTEKYVVAGYGSQIRTVIRKWKDGIDPKVGDIAAVRFHDLDRNEGCIKGELLNILPEEFRKNVVPESNIRCRIEYVNDAGAGVRTLEGGWSGYIPKEEWSWTEGHAPSDGDIGTEVTAKVIRIDYSELSATLSRRRAEGIPADICPISVGETVEVVIKDVHTGGGRDSLYVSCSKLPYLKGTVQYKELGWLSGEKSAAGYRPGQRIKVLVTGIDYRKISFKASIRKLRQDKRQITEIIPGEKLEVTVRSFAHQKFQAEVTYGKHKGILRLDEEYWKNIEGLTNYFMAGREIEAVYQEFKGNTMDFVLPADEYAFDWKENIEPGSIIEVKVVHLTESSILVNYNGLIVKIRKEELSWSPGIIDIYGEFDNDELLKVSVEAFDAAEKKIRLSRRRLLPNPYDALKDLKQGEHIHMTIRRFNGNGIIGEYKGAACILPYDGNCLPVQKKYFEGTPLEVEVVSIDRKAISVTLNSEDIRRAGELTAGYGYWGEVIAIDGNVLTLEVEGYQGRAEIDPVTLNEGTVEGRYMTGNRYWFVLEAIADHILVMTNVRTARGDDWYMQQAEGTELNGDIIEVSDKKITVFAKGMYFDYDKDNVSMFALPDAKIMHSVGEKIRLTLVSKSPLDVRPSMVLNNLNALGLKEGDAVEGHVTLFQIENKTVYIKDESGLLYTMEMSSEFRQPVEQTYLHHIRQEIKDLHIKAIDQDGRRIIVAPQNDDDMTLHAYDFIKDGDIVSAEVVGQHQSAGYILKHNDWYMILPHGELPSDKRYEEGERISVRITCMNRADNTIYCSVNRLKQDPATELVPGREINVEYLDIVDGPVRKCRIRVDGAFDCLCIPDGVMDEKIGTKGSVFIQKTAISDRTTYTSDTMPDMTDPVPGEHILCRISSYNQATMTYTVDFIRNRKPYQATMDEKEMLWHSTFHPCLINKKFMAVVTANSPGGISVNARCLTADPLIYIGKGPHVKATVIGYDKFDGYIVTFGSSMGFVRAKELLWQVCDLKGLGLFWSLGQNVDVCIKHMTNNGKLEMSHRDTYENPFLKHTVKPGDVFRATVRRCSNYNNQPCVIAELDYTGIEVSIDTESIRKTFTHGTTIRLPHAGKKIQKIRVTDVQQVSPDYRWTHRITAVIESLD